MLFIPFIWFVYSDWINPHFLGSASFSKHTVTKVVLWWTRGCCPFSCWRARAASVCSAEGGGTVLSKQDLGETYAGVTELKTKETWCYFLHSCQTRQLNWEAGRATILQLVPCPTTGSVLDWSIREGEISFSFVQFVCSLCSRLSIGFFKYPLYQMSGFGKGSQQNNPSLVFHLSRLPSTTGPCPMPNF